MRVKLSWTSHQLNAAQERTQPTSWNSATLMSQPEFLIHRIISQKNEEEKEGGVFSALNLGCFFEGGYFVM